ncbi:response regulator [Burkholderia pyrrocinia]
MMTISMNIIAADDHPLFTLGVGALVAAQGLGEVTHHAANSDELVALLKTAPCDLLITDYAMPSERHGDGVRLIGYVRRAYPSLPIVVLTMLANASVHRTIWRLGVAALVSKSDLGGELPAAIRSIAVGQRYLSSMMRASVDARGGGAALAAAPLSPREAEVLRLFAAGLSASGVAEQLQRSIKTVSRHKRSGMAKLGVSTDSALFRLMSKLECDT